MPTLLYSLLLPPTASAVKSAVTPIIMVAKCYTGCVTVLYSAKAKLDHVGGSHCMLMSVCYACCTDFTMISNFPNIECTYIGSLANSYQPLRMIHSSLIT